MGESITGTTSKKRIQTSTFFYALIACIIAVITLTIILNSLTDIPLVSQSSQAMQSILEKMVDTLHFNPTLIMPFITVAAIALKLKKKTKNAETPSETTTAYYKPRKNLKVENPAQQRIKIVASAPASYFSELIKRVYNETTDIYGNVPLWVRYNMNILGYSWSLNNIKASHDINVYGESTYVQKFLKRLNEELQTLQKNAPTNTINIHSIKPETTMIKTDESIQEEQAYPKELKKALKRQDNTTLLSGLGLFAIALLTMFASHAWKRKHAANNVDSTVEDEEALQNASKVIRQLGINNQELKAQRRCDDGWMFQFTDYEVFVNRQGMVTSIRRNA